jgi:hypothetical protein
MGRFISDDADLLESMIGSYPVEWRQS